MSTLAKKSVPDYWGEGGVLTTHKYGCMDVKVVLEVSKGLVRSGVPSSGISTFQVKDVSLLLQ